MFVENLSLIPTTQTTYIVSCDAADQKEIALGYRLSRAIYFFSSETNCLVIVYIFYAFLFFLCFCFAFFPWLFSFNDVGLNIIKCYCILLSVSLPTLRRNFSWLKLKK